MIRTLRAYFLSRLLREKLLLLVLIAGGTLWWLSAFSARAGQFWRTQSGTTSALTEQGRWLNDRAGIEAAAQKAASRLESAKTLDSIRLVEALNQAATEAGLRTGFQSNPAKSDTSGQFTVHSVDFLVQQADYGTLQRFYLKVQQRAPYIGIETLALQINQADAGKVTLSLRASAVEIQR